jgi:hypothetical protein
VDYDVSFDLVVNEYILGLLAFTSPMVTILSQKENVDGELITLVLKHELQVLGVGLLYHFKSLGCISDNDFLFKTSSK